MRRKELTLCLLLTAFCLLFPGHLTAQAKPRIITTIAGGGTATGDGGSAVQVQLISPVGVAVDAKGNVYIADIEYGYTFDNNLVAFNHRVYRVGPDGIITTFAGTGRPGFSGDGGPAVQAELSSPRGVAVDAKGNVYIADEDNHRVRRVGPDGIITTFAGTGGAGFSGDGGPAVQAQLGGPRGVAVDAKGNVYIADPGSIRRVGSNGKITTFFHVTDTWGKLGLYSGPYSVAVDADGNVYAALDITVAREGSRDLSVGRIGRVEPNGNITILMVQSALTFWSHPQGVAVDAQRNVYIADPSDHRVRRVGPDGSIAAVAGTGTAGFSGNGGPAVQAELSSPNGVAVDAEGNVYIADTGNHRVRRVGPDGIITAIAEMGTRGLSGDGGPAVQAQLSSPNGVAVDAEGNIYIADTGNNRIRRVGPDGVITTFAGTGIEGIPGDGGPAVQAELSSPKGVAVDARGNVYIADTGNNRIRRVGPDGIITVFAGTGVYGFSGDGGPAVQAELSRPKGVAVDAQGNVYIADYGDRRTIQIGNNSFPDSKNNRIRRVGPDGIITIFAGTGAGKFSGSSGDGGPAIQAQLNGPSGLAMDANGNVYIADEVNHRIRRVGPDGIIMTIAGRGPVYLGGGAFTGDFSGDGGPAVQAALNFPSGVTVDANGVVYIADRDNNRIRRVGPDGIITTIAGTNAKGFSGDGELAFQASLNLPSGVTVDAKGNLYIADTGNNRIRRVISTEPSIMLSVSSLTLDIVKVGVSSQRTFTISDTGNASLSINITVTGRGAEQFKVSPTTATIAAGQSQIVTVTFTPTSAGVQSVTLVITHNAAGSPSTVALSGRGVAVAVSGRSSDFNGDGVVDFDDFFLFAAAFGKKQRDAGFDAKFDLDSDGEVGFNDFFIFAVDFGKKI